MNTERGIARQTPKAKAVLPDSWGNVRGKENGAECEENGDNNGAAEKAIVADV